MTDKVAGRVAFRYNNQEGYLKNIYPYAAVGAGTFGASDSNSPGLGAVVDLGDDNTFGARGSLLIELNDDVELSFSYNLRNFDADKFDSYVLANLRLSWFSADADWETSLIVRNVTDERAGTIGFDLATLCGCNEVAYREPRWYGVSVRYNF